MTYLISGENFSYSDQLIEAQCFILNNWNRKLQIRESDFYYLNLSQPMLLLNISIYNIVYHIRVYAYHIYVLKNNIKILILVADNISYGKATATQREIEASAKAVGVHDFICNLPEVITKSVIYF